MATFSHHSCNPFYTVYSKHVYVSRRESSQKKTQLKLLYYYWYENMLSCLQVQLPNDFHRNTDPKYTLKKLSVR